MRVNPNILLQGPWYCLEQCGLLLQAAVTLFEAQQYPTAAALALLAHEELGKYRILIDLWWETTEKGAKLGMREVRDAYRDHVERQRRGQLSIVLKGIAVARDNLFEFAKRKAKRTPDDRHRARMRAHMSTLKTPETVGIDPLTSPAKKLMRPSSKHVTITASSMAISAFGSKIRALRIRNRCEPGSGR